MTSPTPAASGRGGAAARAAGVLVRVHHPDVFSESDAPIELVEALELLLDLSHHQERHKLLVARSSGWGRALVFQLPRQRRVHVVGDHPLAELVRELVLDGTAWPWSLAAVPTTVTSLDVLLERGWTGAHTALVRAGFSRLEEVAALPDACLQQVRNLGERRLALVRAVAPHVGPELARPGPADAVEARRSAINAALGAVRAGMHHELVELLALSDLAEQALDVVVAALADEDLPPTDPVAVAVLAASREPALLRAYEHTHRPWEPTPRVRSGDGD